MPETLSSWPDFLASQGAVRAETGAPDPLLFPSPARPESGFVCALGHLGVISATGDDAANFLHNQLTNDVLGLDGTSARLAGYCSPKGRLLATMLVWKDADAIRMALPNELLPAILKRLRMFVLRSKVTLDDSSERRVLLGMAAPALPALPAATLAQGSFEGGTTIRLPDAAGLQRLLWAGTPEQAIHAWQRAALPPAPSALWRWTDILAGLPQVVEATREQFVPQMINYELVGGVNFRKGCYPGQEVVARSQYRGTIKRRAQVLTGTQALQPGQEVFHSADPDQPAGMVVLAGSLAAGRYSALVELKLAALDDGSLHAGSAAGPLLALQPLPYAIADEVP